MKELTEKSKLYLQRTACVLLAIVLITLILLCYNKVLRRKDSEVHYKPFMTYDTDYDVWFLGSSHVINGVIPMQLWKDYGITSYNLAMHQEYPIASYEVFKLSLQYKQPKYVFIDVFRVWNDLNKQKTGYGHQTLDAFPLNLTKLKAIYGGYSVKFADRNELAFPFMMYHSRWSDPEVHFSDLYKPVEPNHQMGSEILYTMDNPRDFTLFDSNDVTDRESASSKALEKIVKICREKDIIPVFMYVPFPADEGEQKAAGIVYKLSKKLKVPYLNMMHEDIVNLEIDGSDSTAHLNASGARKVTDYLGKYLKENYELTDYRENPEYAEKWNKWYEEYRTELFKEISALEEFPNCLMALNNQNFKAELYCSEKIDFDNRSKLLIAQLGENIKIIKSKDYADSVILKTIDSETGKLICEKKWTDSEISVYRNKKGLIDLNEQN